MEKAQLIDIIEYCLKQGKAHELPWCEFKKNFHSSKEIGGNISAIANTSRILDRPDGYVIFGIDPDNHTVVGTNFKYRTKKGKGNEDLLPWLIRSLDGFSDFNFYEIENYKEDKNIVVLVINSAETKPVIFDGTTYVRVDTYTKSIVGYKNLESKLWEKILGSSFDTDICLSKISDIKVTEYIDLLGYAKMMGYEINSEQEGIEKLLQDDLLKFRDGLYDITNACALLFAKDLTIFNLKNKSPRVITYRGKNRLHAISDVKGKKGYAIAFPGLIKFVLQQVPKIETIEEGRVNEPLYPKVALREFIANSIIHQDLRMSGVEVLIEIFDDRVEISNPGIPLIEIDRFVDHPPKSRNELLADFMRRANHCERRGSGVDRAMNALRISKLPNPKMEKSDDFTRVILFRTRPIGKLTNKEKSESIYWHCVLVFVLENEPMTNDSVCERFGIEKQNSAIASRLIKLALEEGKIKPFDPKSNTRKHAKYIPHWVQ
ncbi:transcriptional regulator [Candidatus Gracilibacteria bacterium 28_42_T64]|nr:transcriptional regulator [Candidatus Gracilibacteria bacterium 28_42_T64]